MFEIIKSIVSEELVQNATTLNFQIVYWEGKN